METPDDEVRKAPSQNLNLKARKGGIVAGKWISTVMSHVHQWYLAPITMSLFARPRVPHKILDPNCYFFIVYGSLCYQIVHISRLMMSSLDLYSDGQNLDNAVGLLPISVSRGRGREKQPQNRNPINNNRISMYVPENRLNNIRWELIITWGFVEEILVSVEWFGKKQDCNLSKVGLILEWVYCVIFVCSPKKYRRNIAPHETNMDTSL